jgi:superfamily II DNA/RNA helicase/transcriptional regulator with XRE-family HTH domain
MPIPADYRQKIRNLRRTLGLKQPDFAALVGVSPITISRWENGQNDPTELAWARIDELANRGATPMGTLTHGMTNRPQLDFGADPESVAAVAEAVRLANGHLASPTFATEISLIDPLPHQRVAVYDQILKSWPIRFLLADDAGAGKTIMTGLTIRELLSRRLIQRVLVVPPAGLVGNWQRELRNLFRIQARIVRGSEAAKGNPFLDADAHLAIVSLDTLRSKGTFARLREAGLAGHGYDLVVFDEAHKLSADRDPIDMSVRKTARYKLAEALAGIVSEDTEFDLGWAPQSLMLLTATPHMGKPYPYFALWRLLEPDALSTPEALADFPMERRARHFIRRTKEEMVKLDGTPLYPQRICDTLGFDLTHGPGSEQELYDETSKYIRDVYNKASTLNRSAARLAMTVFQRRLASSTYALKKSFDRRAEKLSAAIKAIEENGLEAVRRAQRDLQKKAEDNELDLFASATADDDMGEGAEAVEAGESESLGALVTENLADLSHERDRVLSLRQMAQDLLEAGRESKFEKLLDTMKDPRFSSDKMLVFTEHRDTANYLTEQLERLGFAGRVAQLHGAMDYVERDRQVEFFRKPVDDGGAKYLIGTDAAGEGVNLQFCWLMVNYDVPWNPARLEQRMGRIHRYGQKKNTVYIANLVAWKTREGKVMKTLLDKLETIRKELGSDKVFDVIGRLFENVSLKSYLDAAIRGEEVADGIAGVLTLEQVRALEAKERALYGYGGEVKAHLPAMREDIERERYLRLMPGYVQRLVERSAPLLGLSIDGSVSSGFRFKVLRQGAMDVIAPEIETYPPEARQRLLVRRPALGEEAIWLHPGEPVFDAISGELLERFGFDALRGAAFVDPHAKEASLFHIATITVLRRGPTTEDVLEHRLVGLRQEPNGSIQECPVEWLLLLRGAQGVKPGAYPAGRECLRLLREAAEWTTDVLGDGLVSSHRAVVEADLPQRLDLVKAGFNRQESELTRARNRLRQAAQDGKKQAAVQLELVKTRHSALSKVRESRLAAIKAEPDQIFKGPARFIAHALIVPSVDADDQNCFDAEVEAVAVKLAMAHEENAGGKVRDVSTAARARAAGLSDFPGFDLFSERLSDVTRCIEVKGRADRGEVFMTQNEWAKAANLGERYWLYVVLDCATPKPSLMRVQDPFMRLLGAAKKGMTFTVGDIRAKAEKD